MSAKASEGPEDWKFVKIYMTEDELRAILNGERVDYITWWPRLTIQVEKKPPKE